MSSRQRKSAFQLHHTGIKTYILLRPPVHGAVFQLHHTGIKTSQSSLQKYLEGNFNCTIQELKLRSRRMIIAVDFEFQLHHTGIKTNYGRLYRRRRTPFQLHHTGIKTPNDFKYLYTRVSFQLHHTGIKTQKNNLRPTKHPQFQLHHTGIKTYGGGGAGGFPPISIAPYRN